MRRHLELGREVLEPEAPFVEHERRDVAPIVGRTDEPHPVAPRTDALALQEALKWIGQERSTLAIAERVTAEQADKVRFKTAAPKKLWKKKDA